MEILSPTAHICASLPIFQMYWFGSHIYTHKYTHTVSIVQKAGGLGELKEAYAFTALVPRSTSMVHARLPGDRAA